MKLTRYQVASARPRARWRLAKALGLPAKAPVDDIVRAANAHRAPKPGACRWPCWPDDGAQCPTCAQLYPATTHTENRKP